MKMPILLLAAVLLGAAAHPAQAGRGGGDQGGGRQDRGQGQGQGQGQGISADDAADVARGQTGGRVLAVKPASGGYQVKVLTPSGEVRYVFVPGGGR